MSTPKRGLYAIIDSSHVAPADMPDAAAAAFAGGAVMLQYRDKHSDAATRHATATRLVAIAQQAGRPLIINDDPQLAAAVGAAGVHLGRNDGDIRRARALLGPAAIIGATCHASLAAARAAIAAGASHVSFGRFFASTTKPQAAPADRDILVAARHALDVPIVAIGGINADNGQQLLDAGADLLAVSGALFGAADITTAAQQLTTLFNQEEGSVQRSQQLFDQARRVIPGGVNSPARTFDSVGGTPAFIEHAQGAYLFDVDGQRYIDYVGSWGPMILGHAHPAVIAAVHRAVDRGLSFGAPTEGEIRLAELVSEMVPSIESMRMVNSGTEATMTALRLARGHTGRDKVLKFAGCYHGHVDALLVKAGSGALTLGLPGSPGVPDAVTRDTLTATYNDIDSAAAAFAQYPDDIACVIVEPVAGNMNCIPPAPGFLQGLRTLCDTHGALLILDEVMTGFRVAAGGAQQKFGIHPDLTTLGKIIGGGMPVGVVGGRRSVMESLAPTGTVYQAGTLSGNPIATAAGIATLEALRADPDCHTKLESNVEQLARGLEQAGRDAGVPLLVQQAGAMFGLFFTAAERVRGFADATACNTEQFSRFFHGMLQRGVYLAPSAFEAAFMSTAHGEAEIRATLDAAAAALAEC